MFNDPPVIWIDALVHTSHQMPRDIFWKFGFNKMRVSCWVPLGSQTPELACLDLKERATICGPQAYDL